MKQLILALMVISVATGASTHWGSPRHNFHHVKIGLDPDENGVAKAIKKAGKGHGGSDGHNQTAVVVTVLQ